MNNNDEGAEMKNMWLYWDVFRRIREMGRSGVCGELCSLRFTWQRPGRSASAEEEFLYGSLVQYLCLAEDLAGSNLKKLYVYLYSNPFGAPNLIIGNFYDK